MSDGKFDEGEVATQVQLGRDVCAMGMDRTVTNKKFAADLLACFVVRDKF